jgi:hypothetical protein
MNLAAAARRLRSVVDTNTKLVTLLAEMRFQMAETQRLTGWRQLRAAWRFWRASRRFDRVARVAKRDIARRPRC